MSLLVYTGTAATSLCDEHTRHVFSYCSRVRNRHKIIPIFRVHIRRERIERPHGIRANIHMYAYRLRHDGFLARVGHHLEDHGVARGRRVHQDRLVIGRLEQQVSPKLLPRAHTRYACVVKPPKGLANIGSTPYYIICLNTDETVKSSLSPFAVS